MVVWIAFLVFIFFLLALDLGVFHRKAHVVSVREALTWTCVWVVLALAFSGFVYLGYEHRWLGLGMTPDPVDRSSAFPDGRINDGWSAFLKFVTGYVVEESLSVDNVFVIAMLFQYFAVPREYQHRVLFWGIIGAVAMRGLMIAIGAQLVAQFSWVRTSSSVTSGAGSPSPSDSTASISSSEGRRAGCSPRWRCRS